ncbi:hypothetical protein CFT12S02855_05445 [Campylobacter fetus subsp. testudinum]|uniref:hypothetical protein n=1 Tax=Campylobacter fetus TaxID=196 RepID=UPI000818C2FB|nr:hypothetical protein [Campylobacter fetus]OCR97781.1 hypothetical protein CFT12S02855_05445 [Campylobacter fetus subsp. testudinum]
MSNNICKSLYLDYGYMLNKNDLTEVLKVSLSAIDRRLKNGKLPPHTNIGSKVLFQTDGVTVFITHVSDCQLAVAGGEL